MTKPLPILYVLDASVAVTGAFVAVRHEAQALAQDVRMVLVLPEGSQIPPALLSDFWRVAYVPMGGLSKNIPALLRYVPVLLRGAWQLRRMMRHDQAALLQVNDFYLMHGLVLRLLGFRGRMVSWVRCDPSRFAGPLAGIMLRLSAYAADRMVVVSSYVRSLLPKALTADILYDYYAGPVRSAKQDTLGFERRLVVIGNYIPGKGQDVVLQAFAQIAMAHEHATLHFYGCDMGLQKNRDYRNTLMSAVPPAIAGRVFFHDAIDDPYVVLQTAYAAVNCSASESFSMTVLEASGAGVPVIATASGGPQEILVDGVTGYLVPVADSAAVAARMELLLQQEAMAHDMGARAAAHVAEVFSATAFRPQLLEILGLPTRGREI